MKPLPELFYVFQAFGVALGMVDFVINRKILFKFVLVQAWALDF